MKKLFKVFLVVLAVVFSFVSLCPADTLPLKTGLRPFPSNGEYLLGKPIVAVVKCESYEETEVNKAVEEAIQLIGGIQDIIKPGDRVGIKPNITTNNSGRSGVTTHYRIAEALIKQIKKITNGKITVMEGAGGANTSEAFKKLGWSGLCDRENCNLVDLNHCAPYADFVVYRVPGGGLVFNELSFNKVFEEIDVFISCSKMKVHDLTGITLCLKNQFGSVPMDVYGNPEKAKFNLHGDDPWSRVPRAINDINACNPINLAVIDGVVGLEGGAGLWNSKAAVKHSKILIIGKNAVAVDAVGTMLMGYNPQEDYPNAPFYVSENHLKIAEKLGLGPCNPAKINIKFGKGIKKLSDVVQFYDLNCARYDIPQDFKPKEVKKILLKKN